ncbi:MAG: hypothetical protein OEL78_00505 [Hyphomicrobiales bacterium]|nr:hypothetical protein [Hyphomicrobiales bacterium]
MSTDNRTEINDCNSVTGWTGDGAVALNTLTGQRYEGSGSIDTQHTNADEHAYTTEDSLNTGTFSLDWSDSTLYAMVKDNLVGTAANGGVQLVIGDGTNRRGYDVGGNDAVGMPVTPFYNVYKLDCSNLPAAFATYAGSSAPTLTTITQVGYGSLHLAKAQGNVANVFLDNFKYIANDSYALTINGGTSGTPETMADVVGDDATNGWGLVANPLGSQYLFFAPTEWGEAAASADHYFTATDEQWFWIGDNGGGHTVGANHFPFRIVGNATDTGSFVINNVVVTNTGRRAQFDISDTDVNTLEIDGCTFIGLGLVTMPQSGGTSRFCTNTTFVNCGQLSLGTSPVNMAGCKILDSNVGADDGAVFDNRTTTAATDISELDNCTFTQGALAHHAIRFGVNVNDDITLTGIEFTGFSSTADANGSTLRFDATSGTMNCNLVNCTVDGNPATTANVGVDDAAGITVTLVVDPKTTKFTIQNDAGDPVQFVRVFVETADNGGGSGFPYQASTTSLSQSAGTATCTTTASHLLATGDQVVIRGAQPDGYNKVASITVTGATTFTYSVDSGLSSPATGTPVVSYVPVHGISDVNGEVQSSKTWPAAQSLSGWARKTTTSPFGKASISVADASGGTNQIVTLLSDE